MLVNSGWVGFISLLKSNSSKRPMLACVFLIRKTDEAAVNGTGRRSEKIFFSGARLAARQTLAFWQEYGQGHMLIDCPQDPLWPGRGQNSISHKRIEI